jgi:hypothetical protein
MKRLWLILFVVTTLYSQESVDSECSKKDSTIKALKEQIKYIIDETSKSSRKNRMMALNKDRDAIDIATDNENLRNENKELKRLIYEAKIKYEQSLKSEKGKQEDAQFFEGFLNSLISTVDDNQSSNPFSGKSSGRTCQYDDNELRKTFDRKLESGKIAYKWECVPLGTHTYWIVE